ncbi:helix-turn-helix domain-containing protein [Cloacibacillus sp. An23]|uniref:PucR family transcriptional regulator n=1 Tax=Cloacibacillus sp. An23 TaxID=1965591 RepID=UPI000B396CC2|nr:helix-turn-helix domain-containing protein [Cloacibacillus sp. An23]OUO92644.1 hypothetical protein B5F39_10865 [Cloacibacillus sp. An23]
MTLDTDAVIENLIHDLKNAFPYAHIGAVSPGGKIIWDSDAAPFSQSNKEAFPNKYKSITTVADENGSAFYKISLPLRSLRINIYIPVNIPCDVLTAGKMAESIIGYSNAVSMENELYSRQRNVNMLLERILHADRNDTDVYTSLLAADLGFDMSVKRVMYVIRFLDTDAEQTKNKQMFSLSVNNIQAAVSSISSQDIAGSFRENEIVICHANAGQKSERDFINILKDNIPSGANYFIDIGPECDSISDYPGYFPFVSESLEFAERYVKEGRNVFLATDFLAEHIANNVPKQKLEHFFKRELDYAAKTPWFCETLGALTENNMEMNAAASSIFIHRNTMVFRVNQIRKKLGLDPINKDSDRFRLIVFYRWHENT